MSPTSNQWLMGLAGVALIAAIAWLAWLPRKVSDQAPAATTAIPAAMDELPPPVEPRQDVDGPLSLAELHWCLTEAARSDAMQPYLATRLAVDRFNLHAATVNDRCGGRRWNDQDRDRVEAEIADSLESIEAGAIEEIQQLNDSVAVSIDRVQELLSLLGYDPGVINGEYGPQTRAAVEAFQGRQGFPVDGLLSQRLLDQLGRAYGQLRIRIEACRMRNLRDTNEQQRAEFRC